MYSIFIMIIIAISVAAAAGFGILSLIKSSETPILIQRNQIRVETVVNTIRSHVRRSDDGIAMIPVGAADGPGGTIVPRIPSISPFTSTTWNRPLIYCPASPLQTSGGGTDSVRDISGDVGYGVDTIQHSGLNYVVAGGPGDESLRTTLRERRVIALVISPNPNPDIDLPVCADVTLGADGTTFLVERGSVVPVYDVMRDANLREFVLSPTGGSPEASPIVNSVGDVADYLVSHGIRDVTLSIPAGSHSVPLADLQKLADVSRGRTIRITGPSTGSATVRVVHGSGAGASVLRFDGTLDVSNVALLGYAGASHSIDFGFSAGPGARLTLRNVAAGTVRSLGGEVSLLGSTSITTIGNGSPVLITGGRVFIDVSGQLVHAPLSTVGVDLVGADAIVVGNVAMSLAQNGVAFRAERGGRVLPASSGGTVSVSTIDGTSNNPLEGLIGMNSSTQTLSITDSGIQGILAPRVSQDCAAGIQTCIATCPEDTTAISGECGSSNNAGLIRFGTSGNGWSCSWTSGSVTDPVATALCGRLN